MSFLHTVNPPRIASQQKSHRPRQAAWTAEPGAWEQARLDLSRLMGKSVGSFLACPKIGERNLLDEQVHLRRSRGPRCCIVLRNCWLPRARRVAFGCHGRRREVTQVEEGGAPGIQARRPFVREPHRPAERADSHVGPARRATSLRAGGQYAKIGNPFSWRAYI